MPDLPDAWLAVFADSPSALATFGGLWLLARVLERVGTDAASALRSVAAALRERRPRTEPGEEPRPTRRNKAVPRDADAG